MQRSVASSLAVGLLTLGAAAGVATAAPFTLEQKNFLALQEVAVMIRSEMQTVYTFTGDSLPFTGTFNAAGWTLGITGSMDGQPVNYSATGVYDALNQKTDYTGGGTVGDDTWAGEGFVSFFDVFTEIDLEFLFKTKDTVTDTNGVKPTRVPDREPQTAKRSKTENGMMVTEGEYYKTIDGVIVAGPFTQRSSAPIPPAGGRAEVYIDDAALFADLTGGNTLTGQLVPEPASLAVLALGGLALARRQRGR